MQSTFLVALPCAVHPNQVHSVCLVGCLLVACRDPERHKSLSGRHCLTACLFTIVQTSTKRGRRLFLRGRREAYPGVAHLHLRKPHNEEIWRALSSASSE